MAGLFLADAVDAAEALLDPVRVPRQVVVDHQVGDLQVDALAGGVGGDEHLDGRVDAEPVLDLAAVVTLDATVDRDDRFGSTEFGGDPLGDVGERVFVLGEHDQLARALTGA